MKLEAAKRVFETQDYQPWALVAEAKATLLRLIYRWTPSDYKGRAGQYNPEAWAEADRGKPTVMVFRNGSTLILLENMTDEEINERLPGALRRDAERKAKIETARSAA